ncbi:ATP-binding cassette domain-containing protein [uncultured Porphyromonas sp.]|uniref:cell division ATP-binding protein FtsE n=1 Tax=uncultured Porphyromonas sp. TaxID=159274 RepID=UPI0025913B5E|nr:ATP-binding cassette domain-containing protein [uncultured Porphyromonas sp.]
MNMAENSVLEYRDVTIRRAENVIIRHTDLQINAGDLVYLIGRVGSGKSTLLKTIYADVPISDGEAHFGKFDLRRIKRRQIPYLRREMGIIFQDFRLMHDRTIEDNLSFVLRATGWSDKREISHRIDEVLTKVGMDHKGYKLPHELSGGEQQRMVIARALLNKPKLILADEPTGNLDPETGDQIFQLFRKITEGGTAVIMSTHNYEMMRKYPSRILKIEDEQLHEMTVRTPVEEQESTER